MSETLQALLGLFTLDFEHTVKDVHALLEQHDAQLNSAKGRPPERLEVFKRSALILTVTSWEAFIEDAIRAALDERLEMAQTPEDVENTFNAVAEKWLTAIKERRPKSRQLMEWTQNRWRDRITTQFASEIERFHTPNSVNVRSLSKAYLGIDATRSWTWKRITTKTACSRLDRLIERRGELVHRGKQMFEAGNGAKRSEVVEGLTLVEKLVECTKKALLAATCQTVTERVESQ